MMLTLTEIILEYICPLLGCLVAIVMFMAPVTDVRVAVTKGTLGSLNPTPWAVMTGNCIGWVTYSYLIQNLFVFVPNATGFMISIWLNMAAVKLQFSDRMAKSLRCSFVRLLDENRKSFRGLDQRENVLESVVAGIHGNQKNKNSQPPQQYQPPRTFTNLRTLALEVSTQKMEAPAPHEKVVIGFIFVWLVVISILTFLTVDIERYTLVIGIVANVNTFFFYGAPLSTIVTVMKTRDSSSIHRRTMMTNTANAVFWTAFGFGIMDWIIVIPNGLGAILGFIQVFLCFVIPRRGEAPFAPAHMAAEEATDSDVEATASTASTNSRVDLIGATASTSPTQSV